MSTNSETNDLKAIILNFRVSELQVLLGFAGRNKSGKKHDLQQRALELLRVRSSPIVMKIRELHRRSAGRYGPDIDVLSRPVLGLGGSSNIDQSLNSGNFGNIPQSRICAVPPMKRDDNPALQPHSNISLIQRQAAAAFGAAALYNFPMSHVASPLSPSSSQLPSQYPIHPDVRFKVLPFYEQLAEILKPTSLQQNIPQSSQHQSNPQTQRCKEAEYAFHMTPHQVHQLLMSKDYKPGEAAVQLQFRLCALDSSVPQSDAFPPGLILKVNGRVLTLPNAIPTNKPGVEPKRPPKPLNITTLCHTNPNLPNKLHVSWNHEYGKAFVCAVFLVERHDAAALLERLKQKGRMAVENTKGLIKKALSHKYDDDICLKSFSVSLVCPLGQCRVSVPCRPVGCSHLNCFDATFYLMMNEKKPTWICAVCNRSISFDDLYIDAYMEEVCRSAPPECREVQFKEDGSWFPVLDEKEDSKKRRRTDSDSDDSETENRKKKEMLKTETTSTKEVMIDLTTTSDEDDDSARSTRGRSQINGSSLAHPVASSSPLSAHPSPSSPPSSSSGSRQQQQLSPTLSQRQQHLFDSQALLPNAGVSAHTAMNQRSVVQSLVAATREWQSSYPTTGSNPGNYYPTSTYPSDYFNPAAAAAAAAAAAVSNSSSSANQSLYPSSNYDYNIFQFLNDERNQMNQRNGCSNGPRDIINLD